MNKQEINENNRLIAEFLKANHYPPNDYELYGVLDFIEDGPDEKHFFAPDEMKFQEDWNWLMAVVEKVRAVTSYDRDRFGTDVLIDNRVCSIKSGKYESTKDNPNIWFNKRFTGNTSIDVTYKAIVGYIKWYNKKVNVI